MSSDCKVMEAAYISSMYTIETIAHQGIYCIYSILCRQHALILGFIYLRQMCQLYISRRMTAQDNANGEQLFITAPVNTRYVLSCTVAIDFILIDFVMQTYNLVRLIVDTGASYVTTHKFPQYPAEAYLSEIANLHCWYHPILKTTSEFMHSLGIAETSTIMLQITLVLTISVPIGTKF